VFAFTAGALIVERLCFISESAVRILIFWRLGPVAGKSIQSDRRYVPTDHFRHPLSPRI
jgi:hypothetical protein